MKMSFIVAISLIFILTSCQTNESRLITLGECAGHTYKAYTIDVDEEEIAANIRSVFAIENAVRHEVTDRNIVETGDTIIIDYSTYLNGELYSKKSGEILKVNANNYLPPLEEQLVGKYKNQQYTIDVIMPDDYIIKDIAGETLKFDIIIKHIYMYDIPEMTDDYFIEKGYKSYDDYFAYRIAMKYDDLEIYQKQLACQSILEQIAAVSTFNINSDDIQKNYTEIYNQYVSLSAAYELPLEDYVESILKIGYDSFEDHCMEKAKLTIMTKLLKEEIIKKQGYDEITDDELVDIGLNVYKLPLDFLVENDTRSIVTSRLLMDYLIDISVAINE